MTRVVHARLVPFAPVTACGIGVHGREVDAMPTCVNCRRAMGHGSAASALVHLSNRIEDIAGQPAKALPVSSPDALTRAAEATVARERALVRASVRTVNRVVAGYMTDDECDAIIASVKEG